MAVAAMSTSTGERLRAAENRPLFRDAPVDAENPLAVFARQALQPSLELS